MPIYHSFFSLSSGLKQSIQVPKGTCDQIQQHIDQVTEELELEVIQFEKNPPHWKQWTPPATVSDEIASEIVFEHNQFVRDLYQNLANWSTNPPTDAEEMTPEFAQSIWYGLSMLHLPPERWTRDTYIEEMENLFEIMQGNEMDGIRFDEDPLTAKQSAAVIGLFSIYLDKDDVRLELPNDCDFLASSDDYYWCPKHGAWFRDDVNFEETGDVVCPADDCEEVLA